MARSKKPTEQTPREPSVFDGEFKLRPSLQNSDGYFVPSVEADEARQVLKRMISGRTLSDDYRNFGGIMARIGDMPNDVGDLISEWMVKQVGVEVIAEVQAEQHAPKVAPPTREQIAQQKINDIAAVWHAVQPLKKKTLIAREMLRRGFFIADVADVSGYSRGTLNDARQFLRAALIREGKELPPNLRLDPKRGAKRTGDDQRNMTGPLAEQNREASRLVASVADVLAPAPPKRKRRAYRNDTEGIASAPINGTWDLGDYDGGETDE